MSLVDVLPVDPVMATTRRPRPRRTSRGDRAEGGDRRVDPDDRSGRHPHRVQPCHARGGRPRRRPPARRSANSRAVRPLAGQGDEEVARRDGARVDRDAGHGRVRAGRGAARDGGDLAGRERDHAAPASAESASRATSRSSNGIVRSASSWPCSCPLPAMTTTSPGAAIPTARSIAVAAVDLDVHREAGGDVGDDRGRVLAARVVGCDDGDVGQAPHDRAHQRPLAAIAVAAASEDADQAPGGDLARRPQHVLEPVRRVGVVDEHREGLAGVDRLEPPGHARDGREARAHGVVRHARAPPRARPRTARSRR